MTSKYASTRSTFKSLVEKAFKTEAVETIEKEWLTVDLSDADKRNILDCILKEVVLEVSDSCEAVEQLVSLAIGLSRLDLCSASSPIILLSDVFDAYTISQCETLFAFVEKHVSVWKSELFFSSCKNSLLRMCNDLLRRLSRSQNTVFRGRILLFLASFFPFSERSGLNLVSEFNLDNANEYKKEEEGEGEIMEVDGGGSEEGHQTLRIDYNLYNKFLTLQDFLRNPTQCYTKLRWPAFALSWTETFQTFQNMKLDGLDENRKSAREHLEGGEKDSVFFAKYLTNPRLLQLQLSDANFRRSLIIQGLVVLQYLSSNVKSKPETFELRPVQQEWVKEQENFLYNLLAETPKGSERFRDMVQHILSREQLWNNWKNDSCPEFKKPAAVLEVVEEKRSRPYPRRKHVGDIIKNAQSSGRYYLGNTEMNRLWNLSKSNLEACKSQDRSFLPSLEQYMAEAISQMDPAAGIEPEYRKVNDPNFGWRALRLFAQKSTCFFTQNNNGKLITKLPEYLEYCMKSINKSQSQTVEDIDIKFETEEGDAKEVPMSQAREDGKMTEDAIDGVATRLGEEWLRLAAKLGYKDARDAHDMLRTWVAEDEDATPENMAYMLEGLKLMEAADYLKTNFCKPDPAD